MVITGEQWSLTVDELRGNVSSLFDIGRKRGHINARMISGELVLDVEGDELLADSAVKMTHAKVTCGYHGPKILTNI